MDEPDHFSQWQTHQNIQQDVILIVCQLGTSINAKVTTTRRASSPGYQRVATKVLDDHSHTVQFLHAETHLEHDLLWSCIGVKEMADVLEGVVFDRTVILLQIVPAKLDKLFPVLNQLPRGPPDHQRCHLEQLHLHSVTIGSCTKSVTHGRL